MSLSVSLSLGKIAPPKFAPSYVGFLCEVSSTERGFSYGLTTNTIDWGDGTPKRKRSSVGDR
jgi:hypothetical protein